MQTTCLSEKLCALIGRICELLDSGSWYFVVADPDDGIRYPVIRLYHLTPEGIGEYCPFTSDVNYRLDTTFTPEQWQDAATTAPILSEEEAWVVISGCEYLDPSEYAILFRCALLRAADQFASEGAT